MFLRQLWSVKLGFLQLWFTDFWCEQPVIDPSLLLAHSVACCDSIETIITLIHLTYKYCGLHNGCRQLPRRWCYFSHRNSSRGHPALSKHSSGELIHCAGKLFVLATLWHTLEKIWEVKSARPDTDHITFLSAIMAYENNHTHIPPCVTTQLRGGLMYIRMYAIGLHESKV
jgi:hypothetical protein